MPGATWAAGPQDSLSAALQGASRTAETYLDLQNRQDLTDASVRRSDAAVAQSESRVRYNEQLLRIAEAELDEFDAKVAREKDERAAALEADQMTARDAIRRRRDELRLQSMSDAQRSQAYEEVARFEGMVETLFPDLSNEERDSLRAARAQEYQQAKVLRAGSEAKDAIAEARAMARKNEHLDDTQIAELEEILNQAELEGYPDPGVIGGVRQKLAALTGQAKDIKERHDTADALEEKWTEDVRGDDFQTRLALRDVTDTIRAGGDPEEAAIAAQYIKYPQILSVVEARVAMQAHREALEDTFEELWLGYHDGAMPQTAEEQEAYDLQQEQYINRKSSTQRLMQRIQLAQGVEAGGAGAQLFANTMTGAMTAAGGPQGMAAAPAPAEAAPAGDPVAEAVAKALEENPDISDEDLRKVRDEAGGGGADEKPKGAKKDEGAGLITKTVRTGKAAAKGAVELAGEADELTGETYDAVVKDVSMALKEFGIEVSPKQIKKAEPKGGLLSELFRLLRGEHKTNFTPPVY